MPLDRELVTQLTRMLRPFTNRIANMVARGVVQLAPDGAKLRLLQLGALFGETIDNSEHFEPYGFTSVPLAGAEHVTIFMNGDRSHPITLAVSDRRYRPTGKKPGEVTMYNNAGASLTMTKDGDVIGAPAPGRKFLVSDAAGGGGTAPLPTMDDFNGIITIMSTCGAGAATAVPVTLANYQTAHPTWPAGTSVLKSK